MKIIQIIFAIINCYLYATVRILTFHYNQPEFIQFQYYTFQKFLLDDFEMIVFNDAATLENKNEIEAICSECGIQCVRFEPEWHLTDPLNTYLKRYLEEPSTIRLWGWNASTTIEQLGKHPSVRHCHVIQYALDHYGYDHNDLVVIMDGDNFIIKPLSIRQLLGNFDIVGFTQAPDLLGEYRRLGMMSPPSKEGLSWEVSVVFIAFDPSKLPNVRELKFHVDVVTGHPSFLDHSIGDSGSGAYRYLKKYPHKKIRQLHWQDSGIFRSYFTRRDLELMGFSPYLIQFIDDVAPQNVQFFAFEHFLHFGQASFEVPGHESKARHLREFITNILYDIHSPIQEKGL